MCSLLSIYYVEDKWKNLKVGDLISFGYEGYNRNIIAIVLSVIAFPDDDPAFISFLYVYSITEKGYAFVENGEVKTLEVL